jgi:hypothetical protein
MYLGFEPGPPRSKVEHANHCAIGAPKRVVLLLPISAMREEFELQQYGFWDCGRRKVGIGSSIGPVEARVQREIIAQLKSISTQESLNGLTDFRLRLYRSAEESQAGFFKKKNS